MTTDWHHLPNAQHLDRIIADLNANPDNWARAFNAVSYAVRDAAWDAAWDDARSAAWDAAWHQARDAALDADWDADWDGVSVWHAASCAARSAIVALITWDDTGDYLDLPVERVRVLAALGDQRAILMLPAVIAFEKSN
jgi:hypothetical protein